MYMYLSDRKRRMYISLTLPQNLSPKKLSLKDIRFLQKAIRNANEYLSGTLVKQQKMLYEKHILKHLKETKTFTLGQPKYTKKTTSTGSFATFDAFATIASVRSNRCNSCNISPLVHGSDCKIQTSKERNEKGVKKEILFPRTVVSNCFFCFTPSCLSLWQKSENYKSIELNENLRYFYFYKQKPLFFNTLFHEKRQGVQTLPVPTLTYKSLAPGAFGKRSTGFAKPEDVNISLKNTRFSNRKKPCKNFLFRKNKFLDVDNPLSKGLLYNSLCVYIQTVKTKSRYFQKHIKNFENIQIVKKCLAFDDFAEVASSVKPIASVTRHSTVLCNSSSPYEQKKQEKKGVKLQPTSVLDFLKSFANPPLFANGKNKYLFCRFLYNREQIKTNINPQVLQNQNSKSFMQLPLLPITKHGHKKHIKFIHEKKKIALFYGQIAKKDLYRLCKSAKSLPGFFQDNMYTLLESRVDVLVYRAGFSNTIAMARQLIREGAIHVNGKPLCSCKILGKPGDVFTFGCKKKPMYIQNCYLYTTKVLYNIHISKAFRNFQNSKKKILWRAAQMKNPVSNQLAQVFYEKNIGDGFLSSGFFLYKSLCKKTYHGSTYASYGSADTFLINGAKRANASTQRLTPWANPKGKQSSPKGMLKQPMGPRAETDLVFRNIYIASILKSKAPSRKNYGAMTKKEHIFEVSMKNIQNANCAIFWGQKPLHLEISQKTTAFIYLYRPQKIVSPVCIDFYALKI